MCNFIEMRKLLYLITLFLTFETAKSQNFIPNGDFEQYLHCPTSPSQIDSALFWMNPAVGASGGTPDYYNQCAIYNVSVPENSIGFQPAHSGNGYSGIFLWTYPTAEVREFIEIELTSPLSSGLSYHFEMYINLGNKCKYTSDAIGAYFSDTIVSGITDFYPLPFTPQVVNTSGNTMDTLNWTLVAGDYNASGGENYLIIGNFSHDSLTSTPVYNSSGPYAIVYSYIDDVSLTLLSTDINENDNSVFILDNPITDELRITIKNNLPSEIILYDITSRKILVKTFTNFVSINTTLFAKGIYIYEIRNGNGRTSKGKVIKQ
jgi:OmpA-OmpF porin, OOP family